MPHVYLYLSDEFKYGKNRFSTGASLMYSINTLFASAVFVTVSQIDTTDHDSVVTLRYPLDRRNLALHIYSLFQSLRKTALILNVSHMTVSRSLYKTIST